MKDGRSEGEKEPSRTPGGRQVRVLFVEDSEDDVLLLVRRLRRGGFEPEYRRVQTAGEMSDALASCEWDLVISDFRMPAFDVPAALEILRESGRDLPFIIVSGRVEDQAAVEFLELGAHDFLQKDNLARLVPAVERELQDAAIREERRRDQEHLQRLVSSTPAVIYSSEPAPPFSAHFVSENVRDVLGHSPVTLVSQASFWFDQIHPEDRDRVAERRESGVEAGEGAVEYRFLHGDGAYRWMRDEFRVRYGPQDRPLEVLGYIVDVTERRHATEALQDMERYYRALIENAADVILVIEPDATIRQASPSARELLGLDPDGLHGRNGMEFVHEDDRERVAEVLQNLVSSGAKTRASYRVIRADGEVRHVESVGSNLLEVPAVRGIVVNTRDVTDRIELEQKLRQSQKMEAVGRLAGGVAHDFNNLLTVIEGHAELLLQDLPEGSEQQSEAEEVLEAAHRAAGLTRQLLAFGKRQVLRSRVLDLNASVRDMARMLRRLIGEDVEVEIDLADAPLMVEADPTQLEQVLLNLAVNARDAMADGGRFTLRTRRETFAEDDVSVRAGTYCVLDAEDTGTGIPAGDRDRIFEPFFSTKRDSSGLGLATVYGIVDQSGGHLRVESEMGRGTTFTLYLPEVEAPEEEAGGRAGDLLAQPDGDTGEPGPGGGAGRGASGGTDTVLVVEDDEDVRPLVRRILMRWDFHVLTATTADEALERIRTADPPVDLLLTDVVLPGITGPDLARRALEENPELRVLFVSGYSDESIRWEEAGAGAPGFLEKPFTPQDLVDKVQSVLAGGRGGGSG